MGHACTKSFSDDLDSLTLQLQSHHKQTSSPLNINLLSYNIFIRPPFINTNGDDYKDERLAEFLKRIQSFDIICLQEMFAVYSTRKSSFVAQAKVKEFRYSASSPKPDLFSLHMIDGGLQILSKFPIVSQEFCPYPSGIDSDYFVQKGALYVKIAIGASKLHLYTTHTQATYENDLKYFISRSEQLVTFHKFVKQTLAKYDYHEEDVVLFMGDFNVDARNQNWIESDQLKSIPIFQQKPNLLKKKKFNEYEAMISCLNDDSNDELEDLVLNKFKYHPETFGAYVLTEKNQKRPLETVLTHPIYQCHSQCLDYVLKYTPKTGSKNINQYVAEKKAKAKLVVKEEGTSIEKFFVYGHDFDQLSDHYGVKISLEYKGCMEANQEEFETSAESLSDLGKSSTSGKSFGRAEN